jgi:hypothetical protein
MSKETSIRLFEKNKCAHCGMKKKKNGIFQLLM